MFRNIIKNTKFVFSGLDKNPYSVLGLSSSATEEEIKNAYFKLAKQYHPDIQPQYADKFKEINEAYNTLKDPTKRAEYKNSQRENNPYSNYNQDNYYPKSGQYWENQQNNEFYQRFHESQFQRYRRYPRSHFGYDPSNPFQQPDMKMRRDFRREYMDARYYQNDPWGRDPLTRTIYLFTFVMSFVVWIGIFIFSFYASKKIGNRNRRQQYYTVGNLEFDQQEQYY